jgi:long-subunit fatty acid transport protein
MLIRKLVLPFRALSTSKNLASPARTAQRRVTDTYDLSEVQPKTSQHTLRKHSVSCRTGFPFVRHLIWRGPQLAIAPALPMNCLPSGVRASLMYYSNIDFSVGGVLRNLPLRGNAFLSAAPVEAAASIPRAVEGVVQFPISSTWFDTVSIKWVNWSVEKSIPVVLTAGVWPLRAGQVLTKLNIFFHDGWTFRNTVTYQWSERLALSVAVGWDRGVSTGWTDNPAAWNIFLFSNYKVSDHLELTGGFGLIKLDPAVISKRAEGGDFDATAGAGRYCLHSTWY